MNIYNELNNNINNNDILDEENINVNELINDLDEISVRIIDDINIFKSGNNLKPPTLLEIFNLQLIEIAIVKKLTLYHNL